MSQKVLLIEGEEEARQRFAQALKDNHYTVSTAKDGPTGVKVLKHTLPDLVISNLVLGDMTAVDVCERIRTTPGGEKIGIILVSNTARSQKYIDGIREKYHVLRFMQKPFPPEELLKVVRESLGGNGHEKAKGADRGEASDDFDKALKHAFGDGPAPVQTGGKDKLPNYFPGLLLHYVECKATGQFRVRKDGEEKTIFLERGEIVGIESKIKNEQLGPVLIEKGVITEPDYLKAARVMIEEGIQLGEALVKLGCLEAGILGELILEHQALKIANCFLWLDAEVRFENMPALPTLKNKLAISLKDVFMQGAVKIKKITNLADLLKNHEKEFARPSHLFAKFSMLVPASEEQKQALALLERGYTFGEAMTPKTSLPLATLLLSGMLTPSDPTTSMLMHRIEDLKTSAGDPKEKENLKTKLEAAMADVKKAEKEREEKIKSLEKQTKDVQARESELEKLKQELKKKENLEKRFEEKEKETQKASEALTKERQEKAKLEEELMRLKFDLDAARKGLPGGKAPAAAPPPAALDDFDSGSLLSELEPLSPPAAPGFAQANAASGPELGLGDELELDPAFAAKPAATTPAATAESASDPFGGDLFGGFETPPTEPPAETTVPGQPATADDIFGDAASFDLAGDLDGLPPGSAPSFGNPDATVVFGNPPAAPAPTGGEEDIFDLAGDLGAIEEGPAPNPDSTMVFAPTAEPAPKSAPPPAAAAPKSGKSGDALFGFEEIDGELDQAFLQNVGDEPPAPTPASAVEAAPGLPVDPFAPNNVRQESSSELDLDDFFAAPKKA